MPVQQLPVRETSVTTLPLHGIRSVTRAFTQGYDANVAHYLRKDAQRIQNPWFSPPLDRDGRH